MQKNWITLYILELEHGCFYVGQSATPEIRVAQHKKGKGAAWTKAHPPIALLERRPAESKHWKEAEESENQLTLMMMRKHGWERVRGGFFTNVSEELTRKNLLHHECHRELAMSRPLDHLPQTASLAVPAVSSRTEPETVVRANRPWSHSEEILAQGLYAEGHSADYIAALCLRTPIAIAARLVRLGVVAHRRDVRRTSRGSQVCGDPAG